MTDVLKVAVVSLRRRLPQRLLQRAHALVVDGPVEAQLLEEGHLGVGAGRAHHPAALDLGDLPHHRAHRPRRRVDQQGLPGLEPQDLLQAVQGRQPEGGSVVVGGSRREKLG